MGLIFLNDDKGLSQIIISAKKITLYYTDVHILMSVDINITQKIKYGLIHCKLYIELKIKFSSLYYIFLIKCSLN